MVLVSLHEAPRPSSLEQPEAEPARRAIEKALHLGEERLRKTLEYAHAGVFEWDIVTGEVFWSPENFELYGVARSERPSYGLWKSCVHPEDRDRAERAVSDAVSGVVPACEVEFRALLPMGGTRWLYSRGEVRRSAEGRPLQMRGLNIDITHLKEVELQLKTHQVSLQESESRYRTLAEHAPDIVARFDRQFRYLYVNRRAEAAYGFTPEQLVGKSKAEVGFPLFEVELWHSKFEKVFSTGEPQELEFTHPGREERHYEARIAPELADDGRVSSLVAVTRDVTAWKKAELELRELDRQRTDFIAVLSHELRNPLAPIRNSLVVLDRTSPGTEVHTRAQQVLVRQTEQLSRLVDDLLDIGRLSHGKIVLQPTRLDAREVVRACCDAVRPLFEARGVDLDEEDWSAGAEWVNADPERLAQMVGNLLNNALKFTPPGGRVMVRVSAVNDRCQIVVRDSGAGIHPSDLARIFEPFVQGSESGLAHGGMGVGLSLVRELASRHGGTVRVSSKGEGRGAEFVIALPRSPPAQRVCPQSVQPPPRPIGIFLVDDNEDSARSLGDLLELDGHRVEIFTDPRAALEALQQRQPALLISDIGLPGMTGYDLIRAIRRSERETRLFAVAMTGYAQPNDRARALEAGFDAHLPKPPSFQELSHILVRAWLCQPAEPGS